MGAQPTTTPPALQRVAPTPMHSCIHLRVAVWHLGCQHLIARRLPGTPELLELPHRSVGRIHHHQAVPPLLHRALEGAQQVPLVGGCGRRGGGERGGREMRSRGRKTGEHSS